jgi:D-glycero-alpha-D-manno-heptose-7-phosphate kinase
MHCMQDLIIRSRAPLRIGLAGGGTDISSYSDKYGGAILNATISVFAYASLKTRNNGKIVLKSIDKAEAIECKSVTHLEPDGNFDLIKGVYNRVVKEFTQAPLSFELVTYVDVPAGSGLGTSSTLVVAILGVFVEWLGLQLGEHDIAHLAYEIERVELGFSGGKQDHYAAVYGGFNFMEFYSNDKVIVNSLRIKKEHICELEFNLVLYYSGMSRLSSKIIEAQSENVKNTRISTIEAMSKLKDQSKLMKELILKGEFEDFGEILDFGWQHKKQTAIEVSNSMIDEIYDSARKAGATGGKISGAGGGGFMFFYCPSNSRYKVIDTLKSFGGEFRRFNFTKSGLTTWRSSYNRT